MRDIDTVEALTNGADRPRPDPAPVRDSAGSRAIRRMGAPIAVCLLTLVAGVGAAAHSSVRLSDHGPLSTQIYTLFALGGMLVLLDILILTIISRLLRSRNPIAPAPDREPGMEGAGRMTWLRILTVVILALLALGLPALFAYEIFTHWHPKSGSRGDLRPPSIHSHGPSALLVHVMVGIAIAVLIVGAIWLYWVNRGVKRRRRTKPRDFNRQVPLEMFDEALGAAEATIERSRSDTDAEPTDPRELIIRCYSAMERVLAEHGSARYESETPTELVERAAAQGMVRRGDAILLVGLFGEARFSTHPMGIAAVDGARGALAALRADLAQMRAALHSGSGEFAGSQA